MKSESHLVKQLIGGDYTYGKLLQTIGAATTGPFFDVSKQARDINLGQMLFVVRCSDHGGKYVIYYAIPPVLFEKMYLPFAAVGSGANYALAALRIEQYMESSSPQPRLYPRLYGEESRGNGLRGRGTNRHGNND